MDIFEPLNRRIKRARKLVLKMTQKNFVEFAKANGVQIELSTYQKLESGHLPYIANDTLTDLAKLLHVSADELIALKEKEKAHASIHLRKFEGTYLKVSYANTAKEHLFTGIVRVQYEPDLRDLRVYHTCDRYQYSGTLEKRGQLVYFSLEEAGKVEKLCWFMRDDVGLKVEVLWGIGLALTPTGVPYAYKCALFRSLADDIPTKLLKTTDSKKEGNQTNVIEVLAYALKNRDEATIYYEKLMQFLNSPPSDNPNMIFAE